ncbi:hypothetical protein [Actinophytocola algeriensis]|uniref:Uncharacterized protein n=1 Tax=Actinophytocola algeriensis TaxID=1768010 RepID=A0A7W7VD78_9PSEU|nr:hypothetical protein [Actinophytocola algeriensis]MBB4905896.1 hypothetical protein [Actinophytocola algeriensis]MBE1472419.1 hypothetical protein [Actinophytocola algeriensis]
MSTKPARGNDRQPGGDLPTGLDSDRLAAVLRAAAAPAHPGELAGEEAALAAFRVAAATVPSRPSMLRTVLAKVLTVKAVILLAVAGSAGIVVAATGGVLPTPWSAAPPAAESSTAAPAPTSADRSTEAGAPRPAESSAPNASPVTELCQRYAAHDQQGKAKALNDPAFGPLVAAAGGKGKVADYCATHSKQPPKPGKPTSNGKPEPGSEPENGKPENNGRPEEKGKPEDRPGKEPEQTGDHGKPTETNQPRKTGNGEADNPRRSATTPARPPTPGHPAHGVATPRDAGPPSQGG